MTVVVIGAGMSGLIAARELDRRGIDVVVLEAADRPGGRALGETSVLGSRLDLGGQWIGRGHHRISALATELGATAYRMHTQPQPSVIHNGRLGNLVAPWLIPAALALAGVEALSRTGTPDAWNSVTVDTWLRRVPSATARRALEVVASVSTTSDLDRFSVQALTRMVRHEGGLVAMLSSAGGAQETLLVEGVGYLIERLAAGLGDRLQLSSPVSTVTRGRDGVVVSTGADSIRADKVIVTVPAPMAAKIAFEPGLPPDRVALQRNSYMGSVYKAIAVYERPFWRDRHGAEILVFDGPGYGVFDSTAPGGPGHLCMLVGGPAGRDLCHLDADARRATLLEPLAAHLGTDVLAPAGWHEKFWHLDEFAGGGYLALPVPGTREGFFPVTSAPIGDIHWAGTETAAEHAGYLEGAIESGSRVAAEVAAEL